MLPLYKRSMRLVSAPRLRLRRPAVLGGVAALALLLLLVASWSSAPSPIVSEPTFAAQPGDEPGQPPAPLVPAQAQRAREPPVALNEKLNIPADGEEGEEDGTEVPLVLRVLLPLIAGYCFGFLGSVPVAGPTSAMVLKLGIQGKYSAGLTIAFGGAISEATYAGIAFWGFGSFLAGAKFLLPVSKVLGAVMFTAIGLVFLRADMKPPLNHDSEAAHNKGTGRPQREMIKNVLMGLTMSGFNPALLATYTGAIASVYGTGMLEFTLFLAFVFAIGVCCGVSSWFYILLSLLKKYKKMLKNHTIDLIMRGLGCFLLALGLLCAKSSIVYFMWGDADSS